MKKNLLLLFGLIAITGSISAMQSQKILKGQARYPMSIRTKELKEKFDDCTKNHSKIECGDIKVDFINSMIDDAPGMQQCRDLLPKNFEHIDSMSAKGKVVTKNIMRKSMDLKFELLVLCLQVQVNENKQ